MNHPLGINNAGYEFREGHLVSQEVARVVEAIKEYEPEIDVEWLPQSARTDGQAAFRIVHRPVGQPEFVLFHVKDESQFDMRVLQRIIANDQRNGKHTLSDFEAWEEAQRLVEHQKFLDEMEQRADIAKHLLNTHLNTYKVDDNLIVKEGIPFNVAKRKH